jgi:hypothetical protein
MAAAPTRTLPVRSRGPARNQSERAEAGSCVAALIEDSRRRAIRACPRDSRARARPGLECPPRGSRTGTPARLNRLEVVMGDEWGKPWLHRDQATCRGMVVILCVLEVGGSGRCAPSRRAPRSWASRSWTRCTRTSSGLPSRDADSSALGACVEGRSQPEDASTSATNDRGSSKEENGLRVGGSGGRVQHVAVRLTRSSCARDPPVRSILCSAYRCVTAF